MAGEGIQAFGIIWDVIRYGWPFFLLAIVVTWKIRWKAWPVDVIIIEKRGSNLIKTNDRGGRYFDKFTGIQGYKLLKSKDTIPVINYDWVLHNADRHTNFLERLVKLLRPTIGTIFFFRYGSKQYKPIKITEKGKEKIVYQEIRDKKGEPIIFYGYRQLDPRDKLALIDFEVMDWDNMNFMIQEQRASIERRKNKNNWLYTIALPLGVLAITALVCILMLKFSFDKSFASPTPTTEAKAETPNIPLISNVIPGA